MSELDKLEKWYQRHCDGAWEHQYGIEIGTIDNPGWRVEIDGLPIGDAPLQIIEEESADSWIRCSLIEGSFKGYGGVGNLERIIKAFNSWVSDSP